MKKGMMSFLLPPDDKEVVSDILNGELVSSSDPEWTMLGTPIVLPCGTPYVGKKKMFVRTFIKHEQYGGMCVVSQKANAFCGCGAKRSLRTERTSANLIKGISWTAWICNVHLNEKHNPDQATETSKPQQSQPQQIQEYVSDFSSNMLMAFSDEELENELKRRRGVWDENDGSSQQ
jgi:hypothetical protein